ncbi:MAG: hypothetical protein NVSMB59_21950 [Vulcanimicrobiaceae bacterium]
MIVDAVPAEPAAFGTIVTIVIDGRRVDASDPARIANGVTVAPFAPFVFDLAERIDPQGGRLVRVTRGGRDVVVRLAHGSLPCCIDASVPLDDVRIPLATVARALGASVAYDAPTHTLAIDTIPIPIATLTATPYVPPVPGSVPTFAPTSSPPPRPVVSGIPHPRRTPVLIEPPPVAASPSAAPAATSFPPPASATPSPAPAAPSPAPTAPSPPSPT